MIARSWGQQARNEFLPWPITNHRNLSTKEEKYHVLSLLLIDFIVRISVEFYDVLVANNS
jgi:hypothetical protein